jgi:signal transduction histidine kinase
MPAPRFKVPPPPQLQPGASYALAVVLPLCALALQMGLRRWVESIPFVMFFFVVSLASSIGGWGPGLVSVVLSAVAGWSFLSASPDASRAASATVGAAVFLPVAAAIAALGALVRSGFRERENATRELAAAVQARDEFISMASHELRTPLTALSLAVHRLTRLSGQPADATAARTLGSITRQVSRLNILVNNLLDVSRLRSGRLHLELEQVDLASVVREVVSRFDEELARAGSTLTLRDDVAVAGRWDRLRLEQVVTNLLSNALKYGCGRTIEVAIARDGDAALLEVSDQGIGIAADDQHRVFEIFERGGPRDVAAGFGVGLWIVREIVAALDGAVRLESAPGAGTRFTVSLPTRGPTAS